MHPEDTLLGALRGRLLEALRHGTPLQLRGAGTKDFYGERLEGEVFALAAHRGVLAYAPEELVITARCGTPLSELEATLREGGQFLPFEPPRFGGDPTVGGIVASGLAGPRRPYVGAVRDFVLGARLMNARGESLRFGGQVMKNVAGFDVARLLCGSLGVLGIITEVSLKVLPRPAREETRQFEWPATLAVQTFNRWADEGIPLSAAAWSAGCARVRLSGAHAAVQAAALRLGGEPLAAQHGEAWWTAVRELTLPGLTGPVLWRVSVPPIAPVQAGSVLIDWGGALRWHADDADGNLRAQAQAADGHAQAWRGVAAGRRLHPLPVATRALHQRLKARFDPDGVFNRGRLIADL
ncbi:MAG: glycolate oxidase subunit GlcE [Gammaproteobacteria bacterium]|nr:glycolate oxidase subunit GlcE [Gammaproteobacteria bacterium]